jgi:fatty acid-binding protein DegV
MVGIRPCADFLPNGYCQPVGKVKGMNKSLEVSVKYLAKTIVDPANATIIVANSGREEGAKRLVELIQQNEKPKEVISTSVGQLSGANIGPGLVAAFYFGASISEGCEKEKALFADIVAGK